jgi:hypothetical protein
MAGMGNSERDNAGNPFRSGSWREAIASHGTNGALDLALSYRPELGWSCDTHGHTELPGILGCVVCDELEPELTDADLEAAMDELEQLTASGEYSEGDA